MRVARPAVLALVLAAAAAWGQEDPYEPVPPEALRGRALALFDGACSLEAPEGWAWLQKRTPPASHLVFKCRGADAALAYTVRTTQVKGRGGRPGDVLLDQAVKSTLDGLLQGFERQGLRVDSLVGEPCEVPLPRNASRRLVGAATHGEQRFHFRGYLWMHEGRVHQLSTLVPAPCPAELERTLEAMARSFKAPAAGR